MSLAPATACTLEPETISTKEDIPAPKRSGGPRTPQGKARSRRNALKTGLRSRVILPDELAEIVERRTAEFTAEYAPRSSYARMLVHEMALSSAQIERCSLLSVVDLDRVADRVELCWEGDRWIAVEEIARQLSRKPSLVAQTLLGTRQGTDWLIERWIGLGDALRSNGGWTDDQRRLAFDMLGVPIEIRDGTKRVPALDDVAGLSALVSREVTTLRERRESALDALDKSEREMSLAGIPLHEDAATVRLRKYEMSHRRAFDKARTELERVRAGAVHEVPKETPPHMPTASPTPKTKPAEICQVKTPVVVEKAEPVVVPPVPSVRPVTRRMRKEMARRAREDAKRQPAAAPTR